MVDLSLLQSVSYIAGTLGVRIAAFYYVMNLGISQRMPRRSSQRTGSRSRPMSCEGTSTKTRRVTWSSFAKEQNPGESSAGARM